VRRGRGHVPDNAGLRVAALRVSSNPMRGTQAQTREAMIESHLPLARSLARRYVRARDMAEDVEQVAAVGLLKAVDRYDPSRGRPFSSFATPTILGEIKRYFRDTRWALHVPRELQERAQRAARESDRLTSELGRAPTAAELAKALGWTPAEVLEAREAFAGLDTDSLDAPVGGDDGDAAETVGELLGGTDDGYELVEDRAALAHGVASLPRRDRLALRLRFDRDMTQAEIGRVLGISQMQVSRILRRALSAVRATAEARPEAAPASPAARRAAATSGRPRASACPARRAA
jgi:RNA polymerase sigma-B factor